LDNPEVTGRRNAGPTRAAGAAGTPVEAPIALRTSPAGVLSASSTCPSRLRRGVEETFRTWVEHGLECADRPCYELYHDECAARRAVRLCVPLKKM
jgi:hypothetical protein